MLPAQVAREEWHGEVDQPAPRAVDEVLPEQALTEHGGARSILVAGSFSHHSGADRAIAEVGHSRQVALLGIGGAALLILLIRWIYFLIRRREGIGLGDAKLMALLAAWMGLPLALLSFAIGVILAAIAGIFVLARPHRVPE